MTEYIDMTPTDEGYRDVARLFVEQIKGDIKKSRKADDAAILDSLIEIVAYLGSKQRAELIRTIREEASRV